MKNIKERNRVFTAKGKKILRCRMSFPSPEDYPEITEFYEKCAETCNGWLETSLFPKLSAELDELRAQDRHAIPEYLYRIESTAEEADGIMLVSMRASLWRNGICECRSERTQRWRLSDFKMLPAECTKC